MTELLAGLLARIVSSCLQPPKQLPRALATHQDRIDGKEESIRRTAGHSSAAQLQLARGSRITFAAGFIVPLMVGGFTQAAGASQTPSAGNVSTQWNQISLPALS